MSKIQPTDLSKITDEKEFMRFVSQIVERVVSVMNGNLDFGNFNAQIVSQAFNSSNVDIKVTHSLNRSGLNYLVIGKNVSCDIYKGIGADTSNTIYLRSTVAPATVSLLLF